MVPAASAPRVMDAVSPPSVCASGTCTVSAVRPVSTTSPRSESSYAPSSISTGTAETGMTAPPTSDSAAPANGSRSTDVVRPPSRPIASRRCSIDAVSFFRGQRMALNRLAHMPATLIKGKPIADRIRAEVAEEVKTLGHIGLVTVLVGDDPASEVYIRLKHKAATEAGFDARDVRLPADTSE